MSGNTQRDYSKSPLEVWLAFAFGVIFVTVLLYLATAEKNPTPLAIRVYVTVLALAAGGIGAVIPGFLELRYKNLVRAGGALALAILVYLNEPTIGSNIPSFVEPTVSPEPVINAFLHAVDSGDPARSWELLPDTARKQVGRSEATWKELYRNTISKLGGPENRALINQAQAESPPGAPPGLYRQYTYRTKYKNDAAPRAEAVIVRANSLDAWEIYSYQVSLMPLS